MQILQALRHGTRDAHLRIERASPIVRGGLTLARYRAHLARLLGFYAPVEAALGAHAWASVGLDFEPRRKVPPLVADLESLGLDAEARASLPRCADLPCLPALPEALGCAYVLEGATRGGAVVGRMVGEALGVDRSCGCAFFLVYGDDGDAMWEAFGAGVEIGVPDEEAGERVLSAARETFSLLQRWLEGEESDDHAFT